MSSQQLLFLGMALGAVTGLLCGLVPLFLGLKRGKRRLGIIGFFVCLIGGAGAGLLLSIPALLIFTWLIVRKSREEPTSSDPESL